jgi:hypothetical protein
MLRRRGFPASGAAEIGQISVGISRRCSAWAPRKRSGGTTNRHIRCPPGRVLMGRISDRRRSARAACQRTSPDVDTGRVLKHEVDLEPLVTKSEQISVIAEIKESLAFARPLSGQEVTLVVALEITLRLRLPTEAALVRLSLLTFAPFCPIGFHAFGHLPALFGIHPFSSPAFRGGQSPIGRRMVLRERL